MVFLLSLLPSWDGSLWHPAVLGIRISQSYGALGIHGQVGADGRVALEGDLLGESKPPSNQGSNDG